ncbi:class I SAM-dependent methyltransferase [Candidatus Binatus sp.]|uniref:class I SAM-dependent methyltransferase n=1 Tax=Candidatus Binatus sp. TaxID=2811406 RepID=UPI003C76B562
MGFYNRYILPHVIEFAMRQKNFAPFRARTAGAARGRVLEIGIGSGLNLASYPAGIETVCGVDPSSELLAKASQRVANVKFPVRLLEASSEELPLEDRSFDTVVMTFTLCSIPDVGAALHEIRRVLKPEGALLFAEHGRAPDADVMRWQDRITPYWKRVGGGCHLNRKVDDLIQAAGFRLERLSAGYQEFAPRPFSFFYEGSARPI